VINIDIVQNKEFSIGYPYNSPIDSYFKSLSPEFISNYNIDDATLETINEHKRAIQQFDKALFTLMTDVSTFINGYALIEDTITSKYDDAIIVYEELNFSKITLEKDKEVVDSELAFMEENKNKLEADLTQAEELLTHYESQLMTHTIVDPLSYISKLNNDIILVDSTLVTISNSINFYLDGIDGDIIAQVEDILLISMYSFEDVLLKKSYESWILRSEQYYKCLVAFYKEVYEATWTPGTSIMYDKNIEYVERSKQIMVDNSKKLAGEYIKEYKFNIEKSLKSWAIHLIETETTLSPSELQDSITNQHISLLHIAIEELSLLLTQKQFAIDSIISPEEFKNYNMYKELIQLKRYYVSSNIGTISESEDVEIFQYDARIAALKDIYTQIEIKLGKKTYLQYYYDYNRTETIINELTHILDVLQLTKDGVIIAESDVDEIEAKINSYTDIQTDLLTKISSLNSLISLKLIEKIEINDGITLLSSNIFATEKLINTYVSAYELKFIERLPMYYGNLELNQYEVIKHIINDNNYPDFLGFQSLKEYKSILQWWDSEEKEKLFTMYERIILIIETSMQKQWSIEFNHAAIRNIKADFYKEYLQTLIIGLYSEIVQYINYKEYNSTIELLLMDQISVIKSILDDYVPMAIISEQNIEIPTTFYDYSKTIVFDVASNEKLDIIDLIMGYITNNYNYMVGINLSYQLEKTQEQEQLKIDLMWENMEIKNG